MTAAPSPLMRRVSQSVMRRARRRAHQVATELFREQYVALLVVLLEELEGGALRAEQIEQWHPKQSA